MGVDGGQVPSEPHAPGGCVVLQSAFKSRSAQVLVPRFVSRLLSSQVRKTVEIEGVFSVESEDYEWLLV